RHTRCYRDWSSDVCSSDLATSGTSTTRSSVSSRSDRRRVASRRERAARGTAGGEAAGVGRAQRAPASEERNERGGEPLNTAHRRSEERRGGEGCRTGGSGG